MKRRALLATVAGAGVASAASSRAQGAPPRVGFLIAGDAEPARSHFRKAMTDLGYVDGRTITIDFRNASPSSGQLAIHAASLVDARVDAIVAVLTPAILAAKQATATIPIVFVGGVPELETATNVARPEGNMTGLSGNTGVIAGKSVQLFRDIKPATRTLGVLLNAPDPFNRAISHAVEAAGRASNVEVVSVLLTSPEELPQAFADMARRAVDGVVIQPSLPLEEAAGLALDHRLPALSFRREFARMGGLVSYGADQADQFRLLAAYLDKVLKGTPTSELPIQMSTRFELIVNQKTAQALGLALSPMFLGRADEVIE